ncbi:MAG TPA: MFS transporter [Chroococcales cyanobacterium]
MATPSLVQEKPTFLQTMTTFSRAFWFANFIELMERWAYYGLRGGFLSVYMVTAVGLGGLGFNHLQKGDIYMWWALIQSLLPMFTGGYADRYGYKKTVAIAISITMLGYVTMGYQMSYWGFLAGCMMVATGTAVFKPGIQGVLANTTNDKNAPLGWSVFYMIVNIGGFVGPLVTGFLKVLSWKYVFLLSAAVHALNFIFLLCFKDPSSGVERETQSHANFQDAFKANVSEFFTILVHSVRNLFEPRLLTFLVVFSGFWLMFMQLFDLLPNYITDWVDSSNIYLALGNFMPFFSNLKHLGLTGVPFPTEWMINVDSGAIFLLMLPIGWTFGKMKPVPAMIIGMIIASVGIVFAGQTMSGLFCVFGIFVFAIGEMIASPRKSEYLASIAPPGKKGLYMGYVSFPQAIGWVIGSKIGGIIYQGHGDKLTLAKQYMTEQLHLSKDAINAIPPEKIMERLRELCHLASSKDATQMLFNTYHPERIWYLFAAIGAASTIGMLIYYLVVERHRTGTLSGLEPQEAVMGGKK